MIQESKSFGLYCQPNIQEPVENDNQSDKIDIEQSTDSKISPFTNPQSYPNKNEENIKLLQQKCQKNNKEDNIFFEITLNNYIISKKISLEAIFEKTNMNDLIDYFKSQISECNSLIVYQNFIKDLSKKWLLIHQFKKNNQQYISYQKAFEFWKFILERQLSKFKSFIDFVVERNQVNPLEVTVDSFEQTILFFFLFQINRIEQTSWSDVQLIKDFLIYEDLKRGNLNLNQNHRNY